jgi:hypothetical protein
MTEYESIIERLERMEQQLSMLLSAKKYLLPDEGECNWVNIYYAMEKTGFTSSELKKKKVLLNNGTVNPDGIFRARFTGRSTQFYLPDVIAYADKTLEEQERVMKK